MICKEPSDEEVATMVTSHNKDHAVWPASRGRMEGGGWGTGGLEGALLCHGFHVCHRPPTMLGLEHF